MTLLTIFILIFIQLTEVMGAYYLGEIMKLLVAVSFSYFQYIWERTFSLSSLHMQYILTYVTL